MMQLEDMTDLNSVCCEFESRSEYQLKAQLAQLAEAPGLEPGCSQFDSGAGYHFNAGVIAIGRHGVFKNRFFVSSNLTACTNDVE